MKIVLHSNFLFSLSGTLEEILKLGPISHIIVPSAFHTLDAPAFAARFEDALVLCPEAILESVTAKVRSNE